MLAWDRDAGLGFNPDVLMHKNSLLYGLAAFCISLMGVWCMMPLVLGSCNSMQQGCNTVGCTYKQSVTILANQSPRHLWSFDLQGLFNRIFAWDPGWQVGINQHANHKTCSHTHPHHHDLNRKVHIDPSACHCPVWPLFKAPVHLQTSAGYFV